VLAGLFAPPENNRGGVVSEHLSIYILCEVRAQQLKLWVPRSHQQLTAGTGSRPLRIGNRGPY